MRVGTVSFVVVAMLAIGSCGSGDESLADRVPGTWVTGADVYVVFHEDGSHGVGHSEALASGTNGAAPEIEFGTWTVEGSTLTFRNDPESAVCSGMVGTYEIEIVGDGDKMLPTLVSDECEVRAEDWDSGLTRWTTPTE